MDYRENDFGCEDFQKKDKETLSFACYAWGSDLLYLSVSSKFW